MKTIVVNREPVKGPNISTIGPVPMEFMVIEKTTRIPLDWNVLWNLRRIGRVGHHVFMQDEMMLLAPNAKLVEPGIEPMAIIRLRFLVVGPSENRGLSGDVRNEMNIAVRHDCKAYDITGSLDEALREQWQKTIGDNGLKGYEMSLPIIKWKPTLMLTDIRDMMTIDVDKIYKELIRKLRKNMT